MIRTALSLAAATALAAAAAAPAAAAPRHDQDMDRGMDRGSHGRDMDRGSHGRDMDRGMGRGAQVHQVDLDALNDSGVDGKATLILRGDELRVVIRAKGLTPGMVHPQHIHGLSGDTNAVCPPMKAQDDIEGVPEQAMDPDDFISLEEGADFYGPVLLPLTPFPVANPAGVVTYSQSFTVDGDLLDLSDEAVVLHGAFLGQKYAATLPVACGEID